MHRLPIWSGARGTNWLDGGSAFYGTYKTKDDKYVSVGPLEPQFYKDLLKGICSTSPLILLHSEWPKLYRVVVVLSANELRNQIFCKWSDLQLVI